MFEKVSVEDANLWRASLWSSTSHSDANCSELRNFTSVTFQVCLQLRLCPAGREPTNWPLPLAHPLGSHLTPPWPAYLRNFLNFRSRIASAAPRHPPLVFFFHGTIKRTRALPLHAIRYYRIRNDTIRYETIR